MDEISQSTDVPEDAGTQGAAGKEEAGEVQENTAIPDNLSDENTPPSIASLGSEVEILTDKRLAHLDRGGSLAYAAKMRGGSYEGAFALVCENHLIPRSAESGKFAGILSVGLIRLVASGVVYWPPAQEEKYVFVYNKNPGMPIMESLEQGSLGWGQDIIMKTVILPIVNVLMDLRDVDLVHGCINPMNLFQGAGQDESDRIVLGECLSAPPSYLQPSVFESIERALVDPLAKGVGTSEDDLYAFGVTLVMMLRNKNAIAGMSDEDIVRNKIEFGSYIALTGKDRFTGSILELLRGLLYDDRERRWSLDEIDSWLNGQRLSPKQTTKKKKASRPLHFNGGRYIRPALLAMDLEANQEEAVRIVDGGELEQWLDRSLEDNLMGGKFEGALDNAREEGRGNGYEDRLLSCVSMALDPEAPIRFKGVKVHPEGFSYALAESYILKKSLTPFVDMINQQLVLFWLGMQQEGRVDVGGLTSKFDSCRAFLRQKTIGYGIERCLYFLNPQCPCLSDKIAGYYVRNPEDMMSAFEAIAGKPNRPDLFVDRHVAAFLSIRDSRMIDAFFVELGALEYYKRILGNIKTLATIQKRSNLSGFPGIAAWVADILDPVYERYHDRELRVALRNKIKKMKKTGNLVKIITLLDDFDIKQRDFLNFRKAMEEYRARTEESLELKSKLKNPEIFGRETGQEVAAVVSGVLAGLVILAFAFIHFTTAAFF